MSVSGLCQICESAQAVDRCERCGALACDTHYERDPGLCATCLAETSRDDDGDRDGGRQFDDADVQGEYRF
ncbi:hypothetical protein G9C85_07450 [Halorubellus sp. JP-L1]|uniref:hypothetical protein n=1 Tax=Halorubellus sp. JP-L1 TaxID=2715753 RepID=UPI00140E9118|nr:hypothetical protein [Halorubellus sp. JP-L1]NHN41473.1 hypothetical protein [Halorubellus sp. JP-L1]